MATKLNAQVISKNLQNMHEKSLPPTGSYFLPNDIAAARRLRKSIDDYGHYRHTAKQKPSRLEALSLLDVHIAALGAIDPQATVNGLPPTMTPASPWHGSLSDSASADEHRGKLDATCLHA